jgi:toxin CcdB
MAQFDVHRNVGQLKANIPFIVLVQSSLFDSYRRRLVVPLIRKSAMSAQSAIPTSRLNPEFKIDGIDVVLHPLEMISIPVDKLGDFVCSLNQHGLTIADALDEVLSRSWG